MRWSTAPLRITGSSGTLKVNDSPGRNWHPFRSSSTAEINLRLTNFLRRPDRHELSIQNQVVGDLEPPCDEERDVDEKRAREQKPRENGTHGRSRGPRHAGNSACGGTFLGTNHRHGVGLSCRNVPLVVAEPADTPHPGEREVGHQWHKYEENIRRQVRNYHRLHQSNAGAEP